MEYNFRFSLTEDDFADFNAYTVWLAPWNKKKKIKFFFRTLVYSIIIMTGITYLIDEITSLGQKSNINFRIGLSLGFGLLSALISYFNTTERVKKSAKKTLHGKENQNFLKETDLRISEAGIFDADKVCSANYTWISIVKYSVTKQFFYLYINSIQAIIVPKRLFNSQYEIDEFDKFVTEKIPLLSLFRSIDI